MLTAEQLAERVHFVGASEAAAVLELDDFKTPLDVYWAKVEPVVDEGSVYTEIGNALEPVILRRYAIERGVVVLPSPGSVRHPKHPMVAATPDGLVAGQRRGIEAKAPVTAKSKAKWFDEHGEPTVPDTYFVQCQMQCEVCDLDAVDLVALIDGELVVREIERDRELGAMWVEQIAGWWARHVVLRDPPEPRDHVERSDFIARKFKRSQGFMRSPGEDDVETAAKLARLKAQAKTLKEQIDDLETTLKARIGDADGIEGIATWKTDKTGRVDWKALAEARKPTPAELAAHTGEPSRRFLLKLKIETENTEERAA